MYIPFIFEILAFSIKAATLSARNYWVKCQQVYKRCLQVTAEFSNHPPVIDGLYKYFPLSYFKILFILPTSQSSRESCPEITPWLCWVLTHHIDISCAHISPGQDFSWKRWRPCQGHVSCSSMLKLFWCLSPISVSLGSYYVKHCWVRERLPRDQARGGYWNLYSSERPRVRQ